MSGVELNASDVKTLAGVKRRSILSSLHILPVLITAAAVAVAALLGWQAWQYYMGAPWTRDGTVRAYVVKIAPQVAGEIVQLPVVDNQFVHKGDLLMVIDPRNYSIAVRQAEAAAQQAQAVADNANAEMVRREDLSDIAVTMEERQTYISQAATAEASYQSALANLEQARVNFNRTQIRSPVNGYVTNLTAQLGDYADVGALQLSIVNSDSYWVDAYFEETSLGRIRKGDAATIKLMGYSPLLRGRVQGVARGIDVPNAAPDASGLASVNPIFTFVRLAQRVPVRIRVDEVPKGVELVAGLTATVQIEPQQAPPPSGATPASEQVSQARVEPAPVGTLGAPPASASQAPAGAAAPAAPAQAANPPASHPPKVQGEAKTTPAEMQQAPASQSSASAEDQLPLAALPSAEATAAAAADAADIKALQQQIAANPPGGGSAAPAANSPPGSLTGSMPPSEYLGQTIDLFSNQNTTPPPTPRSPESIRRRARSSRLHYGHQ